MCTSTCAKVCGFMIGLLLVILGVIIVLCVPTEYVKFTPFSSFVMKEGSGIFKDWTNNPTPVYTHFTLFNWTNPNDIYNPKIKPNFVEMGPYVFRQINKKEHIKFYKNNTLSYYQNKTWFFEPKMSNGKLDDMVTSPHVITVSLANIERNKDWCQKNDINSIMLNHGGMLATTHSVAEWIFNGFSDELLNKTKLDKLINYDYYKYGYFMGRNGVPKYDGEFMIDSGAVNTDKLGELTHWNQMTNNGFYPGECGKINGSTGDIFPPKLNESDLTIYSTDVCRFLNLAPNGKVNYNDGDGLEWIGTADTLDSGIINPKKKCFKDDTRKEEQPLKGVADCRKCHNDWPIYASFPHFYLADKQYVENVTGLKPVKDKHQYSYVLKPQLGLPLEIKARIQMNLLIQRDNDFDMFRNVPDKVMMPMYYMEERSEFKFNHFEKNFIKYGSYFLIVLGFVIIVICILIYIENIFASHRGYQPLGESRHSLYSSI